MVWKKQTFIDIVKLSVWHSSEKKNVRIMIENSKLGKINTQKSIQLLKARLEGCSRHR